MWLMRAGWPDERAGAGMKSIPCREGEREGRPERWWTVESKSERGVMWDVVVLSLIVYWKRSCLLFFFSARLNSGVPFFWCLLI
jgi:hypothetical protein